MDVDVAEICRRLVANDPTLTTLYVDFSWQPDDWKRLLYQDFPKNHTVSDVLITNFQSLHRLPVEEAERLAQEEYEVDGEPPEPAITSSLKILDEFFQAVAFAFEHHSKLRSFVFARFDIVSSYSRVVQAMQRKAHTMQSKSSSERDSNSNTLFLWNCVICGCHVIDHTVIRDLLSSNVLQSFTFHDCIFATPPSLAKRCTLGLTTGKLNHLKTFVFQTESGPPPTYLMQDVQVLLQQNDTLKELNIRCEGREEDWWTLANAFASTTQDHMDNDDDDRTTKATKNITRPRTPCKLQRLQFGLYGSISIDIIQAISFICCDKSTASCVKGLDFSHSVFSYDALELLTLVLSRVADPVVDTLNLTEVTLDDEDDHLRSSLYPSLGAMLVRKLIVQGIGLDSENWASFSQGLALNVAVECLDVSSNGIGAESIRALGQRLIAANANRTNNTANHNQRGMGIGALKELHLEDALAGDEGAEFMAGVVLREPTMLQVLSIDCFNAPGLMAFARGVASMPTLRKLTFGVFVTEYTTAFFKALLQSLQINTTLWELNLEGLALENNKIADTFLPQVKYWLSLNKAGRGLLGYHDEDVALGLWLHVLARSSHDVDALFYFVRENTRLWPFFVTKSNYFDCCRIKH